MALVTVAMLLADSIGNGGAGNSCANRGNGKATTINQNVAAVETKTAVVAAAMELAASVVAVAGGSGGRQLTQAGQAAGAGRR